jgi:hypothetical protein
MTRGVIFDTQDGRYDGVVVWARDGSTFLDSLATLEWPLVR